MKANEIPEKIYVPTAGLELTDKLPCHIEYTRTDVLIDKACEWLSKVSIEDMHYQYNDFDTSEDWYKFIEDFKKAMEE